MADILAEQHSPHASCQILSEIFLYCFVIAFFFFLCPSGILCVVEVAASVISCPILVSVEKLGSREIRLEVMLLE